MPRSTLLSHVCHGQHCFHMYATVNIAFTCMPRTTLLSHVCHGQHCFHMYATDNIAFTCMPSQHCFHMYAKVNIAFTYILMKVLRFNILYLRVKAVCVFTYRCVLVILFEMIRYIVNPFYRFLDLWWIFG